MLVVDYLTLGQGLGKKSGNETGYFYGLGLGYSINEKIAVNLEYNTQSLDLNTPVAGLDLENDLSIIKFGVSYNF